MILFVDYLIRMGSAFLAGAVRIIVQLVVVAALVTIVSEILKAFAYDVSCLLYTSHPTLGSVKACTISRRASRLR